MKNILVIISVFAMAVLMSSCFCPSYLDDAYYAPRHRVVVVDGHHHHHRPAPRPVPRHRW